MHQLFKARALSPCHGGAESFIIWSDQNLLMLGVSFEPGLTCSGNSFMTRKAAVDMCETAWNELAQELELDHFNERKEK